MAITRFKFTSFYNNYTVGIFCNITKNQNNYTLNWVQEGGVPEGGPNGSNEERLYEVYTVDETNKVLSVCSFRGSETWQNIINSLNTTLNTININDKLICLSKVSQETKFRVWKAENIINFDWEYVYVYDNQITIFDFKTDGVYGGKANPHFTVSFNSNGGSNINPINNVFSRTQIIKPINPIKEGYTFEGWFKDSELTQGWDFDNDYITIENITLYAKWEPINRTLRFRNWWIAETGIDLTATFDNKKFNLEWSTPNPSGTINNNSGEYETHNLMCFFKESANGEIIYGFKNAYNTTFSDIVAELNANCNTLEIGESLIFASDNTSNQGVIRILDMVNIPAPGGNTSYLSISINNSLKLTAQNNELTSEMKSKQYSQEKINVLFNLNGGNINGSTSNISQEFDVRESVSPLANNPIKDNSIFENWTRNNEVFNFDYVLKPTDFPKIDLVAKWQSTISGELITNDTNYIPYKLITDVKEFPNYVPVIFTTNKEKFPNFKYGIDIEENTAEFPNYIPFFEVKNLNEFPNYQPIINAIKEEK